MSITRSTAASRMKVEPTAGRQSEFRLLVLVSIILVAGIWLLVSAQATLIGSAQPSEPARPLNLNESPTAAEIQSALDLFDNPKDRSYAAGKIMTRLHDGPLESVSDLRSIRITLRDVERTPGLAVFAERARSLRADKRESDYSFPLFTSSQMRSLRSMFSVRGAQNYYRLVILYGALFFASFFALHLAWRMRRFTGDQYLLPAVMFLSGIGFIMMIRLRDPLRDALLLNDFALGVAAGCILAFAVSIPDYEKSPIRKLAYVPLLLSFLLSLALILFGSGPGLSDARVNLKVGPFQFQPVELIKLLLIFFLAGFFADRWEFLRKLRQAPQTLPGVLRGLHVPMLRYALPLILAVCFAVAFFFLEKDLGPALVMTILFLLLYFIARSRAAGALAACAALAGAVGIGYALNVPRTVSGRLSMWLSPWDNFVRPGGDHLAQSLWTFSTGGLFGTGLGLGDPNSVPAAHTDLILAAIGEELGFIGLLCVVICYCLFIHRALRISTFSRGPYSLFLGVSATLLIALQAAFIAAGILGILPLSGVVTPFVNYGKSSTISNFALLGILASLSRNPMKQPDESFDKQILWVKRLFAAAAVVIVGQAAWVQVLQADEFLGRGALITQADGHRRFSYNPRVLEAARSIPRGSIYDRNGIPLASDSATLLQSYRKHYARMNVDIDRITQSSREGRYYPFGALTFHLLGDLNSRLNWGAPNSSYAERDLNTTLQGYDAREVVVRVKDRPDGPEHLVVRRDLRELIPLVRHRHRPDKKEVRELLNRDRDVRLSVDVRLQAKVAAILERRAKQSGTEYGAAVVIDPATGDLLASVSYPWADIDKARRLIAQADIIPEDPKLTRSLLDRARYGLYPPGSSFKLVTALAALQANPEAFNTQFECRRLPDGRVGNYVRGWGRPIRDDILDKQPHGHVDMGRGIVVSCNAYFAQLGALAVGAEGLLNTAGRFGIRVAAPNTAEGLKDALAQASYGQGQVLASPLQMARVAGSISNGGGLVPVRTMLGEAVPAAEPCVTADQAFTLAQYMRRAVTEGTGSAAAGASVAIAGKTGTAELRNRPAHAWFAGFAPYGTGRKKIAFAVLIENGRYGGRAAAPAAAEIADAAAELGFFGGSK